MRIPVTAALLALVVPAGSSALAQSGRVQSGSARPARTAAVPAPVERTAPVAASATRDDDRRGDRRDDGEHHRRRAPRYIILGDGTVLADLGYGYEQVIRSCASQGVAQGAGNGALNAAPNPAQHPSPNPNTQPVPNQAAPYQPPVYTPPVYTPPVYTPPVTANAGSQGRAACWTTDRNGQVVIVQP